MSDFLSMMPVLGAGIGLGIFYFGGLWWTVRQFRTTRRPALLSLLSFFGRLGVVLFGFFLIMDGQWQRLLVCLLGFLGVRVILVRRWGPKKRAES